MNLMDELYGAGFRPFAIIFISNPEISNSLRDNFIFHDTFRGDGSL